MHQNKYKCMKFMDYLNSNYEGAGFVFIDPDKNVLTLQKPNGKWSFVGGHKEKNETPLKTAKRECKEEIGFLPKGNIFNFVKYKKLETNMWCYSFLMNVKKSFKPKLSNEHVNYKWIAFKDLEKINLSKAIKDLVPHLNNI